MKRLVLLSLVSLTACGGPSGDEGPGGDGVDAPPVATIEYTPFTARTRSIEDADSYFLMSITDTVGPIACGAASDHHNALGTSGHQILANVGYVAGYPCPTGTHSIKSTCPTTLPQFYKYVDDGCAYYRRFNAQGQVLGLVRATAGAINVTGDDRACVFTVNLSFSGEAYTDSFTLTNGLGAQGPWCKQ